MNIYEKDEEKQRALLGYADNQVRDLEVQLINEVRVMVIPIVSS